MITRGEQLVWKKYEREFIFDNGIICVYPSSWKNGHPVWKVEKGEKKIYYINCEEEIWIMRSDRGCNVAFEQHLNSRFPFSLVVNKSLTEHFKRLDRLLKYIPKPDKKKEFICFLVMIFNRIGIHIPMEMIFHLLYFMREIDFLKYDF